MERRLKRLPGEFYFFGLLPFLARLPYSLGYRLAAAMGRRLFRSEVGTREIIERNVKWLHEGRNWPSPETIACSVFENLFCEDLDSFHYRSWNPQNLDNFFRLEGLHYLERQVANGQGAILMTAHIGAPCAAMVALGIKGFPLTHVSREYRGDMTIPRSFRSYAIWKIGLMEEKMGNPLINAYGERQLHAHRSVLEILKHLKQGHFVSMALDVNPAWLPEILEVPFFGRPGRFSPNLVKIASAAEVPLIPYFILRDSLEPHRHRVMVKPPVALSGDPEQDLRLAVSEFEEVLTQHPDQWFSWDSLTHFLPGVE